MSYPIDFHQTILQDGLIKQNKSQRYASLFIGPYLWIVHNLTRTQFLDQTFPEWLRVSTIRTSPLRRRPFRIPLTSLALRPRESHISLAVHFPLSSMTLRTCFIFSDLAAAILTPWYFLSSAQYFNITVPIKSIGFITQRSPLLRTKESLRSHNL